jgi:hypothetical protein
MIRANTWTEEEVTSYLSQLIRENDTGPRHKETIERLIHDVNELLNLQAMFFSGHKSKLPECKKLEKNLVTKIQYLQSTCGYSIDRFKKQQPTLTQGNLL